MSVNPMSAYFSVLDAQRRQRERMISDKRDLLTDPQKMDKLVAGLVQPFTPSPRAIKSGKYASAVEALEAQIPKGHATKGMVRELRDKFKVALQDQRLLEHSPEDIAIGLSERLLLSPAKPGGRSRLEESYWHKRLADSAWLGIGGEDESIQRPPGYENWVTEQRQMERAEAKAMPWFPSGKDVAVAAGTGAGVTALIASPLGITAGAGAVLGGVSGGAYEFVQKPWSKILATTEWGSARMHSGSVLDKVKVLGAEYGPPLLASARADKALIDMFTVSKNAALTSTLIPSADNVLNTYKHNQAMKKFVKKNLRKELGLSPDAKRVAEKLRKFFGKTADGVPDEISTLEIVKYTGPSGAPDAVLDSLANQQRLRDIADGKISIEEAERRIASRMLPLKPAVLQLPEPQKLLTAPDWTRAPVETRTAFEQLEAVLYGKKGGVHYTAKQIEDMEFDAWAKRARWSETSEAPLAEGPDVAKRITALEKRLVREAENEDFRRWGIQSQRSYARAAADVQSDPVANTAIESTVTKTRRGRLESEPLITPGDDIAAANEAVGVKKVAKRTIPKEFPGMQIPKRLDAKTREIIDDVYRQVLDENPEAGTGDLVDALKRRGLEAFLNDEGLAQVRGVSRSAKKAAKDREIIESVIKEADEYDDKVANDIKKNLFSIDEGDVAVREVLKSADNGEITLNQAIDRVNAITEAVDESARQFKIPAQSAQQFRDETAPLIYFMQSKMAMVAFFGLAGIGAAAFHLFNPDTAEAGMGSLLGKAAKAVSGQLDTKMIGLLEEMSQRGLHVEKITSDNVVHIMKEGFQRGLQDSKFGGPTQILKSGPKWIVDATKKLKYSFMSPYQVGEVVLDVNRNKLNNPAVWRASYSMAEYMNIHNGQRVFRNILTQTGISSDKKMLQQMFEPLAPMMKQQVEYDHALNMMRILDKAKARLLKGQVSGKRVRKSKYGDIEAIDAQIDEYQKMADELAPAVDNFHKEYLKVAEQAAAKSPSARLFYALDDTTDFEKYPFLARMNFTAQEKQALGQMREQLLVYKQRLKDLKVATKDGPYAHYLLHPGYKAGEYEELAGDLTRNAYTKFYRRSANSRPLIPDIDASLQEYVYDIEKRIQSRDFWRQGWHKVERKYGDIYPVIGDIFRNLREGVVPTERTLSNKALRMYYNIEVLKHLFLNPSAGLKHLCKISGDIATRGPAEVARGVRYGAQNVGWRVRDLSPHMNQALDNLGFTSVQGKERFLKNYMDSMIPTMHYHQRMVEMGLMSRDDYFDTAIKIWNRASDAGGRTMSLGSVWISMAELFDRGTSLMVGLRLAAKQGMTVEQAYYANLDLILKNNFLGREQNPAWLRNPKFRALFVFQATPFKIMERRLTTAIRANRSIRNMGREVFTLTKTPEGREALLQDMKGLWSYMKNAERETKANIFIDALRTETDVFGNPMLNQFAKEVAVVGSALTGGAYLGVNLKHHFFHIPFLSGYTHEPTMQFSPGTMAAIRGWHNWKKRDDLDDEFLFTKVLKNWMGGAGPMPTIFHKMGRLSRSDIPDIYQDSKFKYFFAIPSKGEH